MKANPVKVLNHAMAAINSCKTNGQLRVAETYAYFAMRSAFESEKSENEYIFQRKNKWHFRLTQACINKQAEFLWSAEGEVIK